MVVFKFTLQKMAQQQITMPRDSVVLSVQAQLINGEQNIVMWAMCDTNTPLVTRTFNILLTGEPFDKSPGNYVGTVQLANGEFVLHVFQQIDLPLIPQPRTLR